MSLTKAIYEAKEHNYSLKKTIRILIYPNITFQENLERDSFVQVIKNQIKELNDIRDDLWFYLILTKKLKLDYENVTQYIIDLPTYPPTMRSHFDVPLMQKTIRHDLDFDLVMSHLPEHTFDLVNVMHNVTHHVPTVFGYCHWFDLEEVVAWPKDSFRKNILGLLEYERCYLNTQHQKDMVLKQAKLIFNDDIILKLNKILQVQHLGVDKENIVTEINETPEKTIVFNHRPDTYKNFNGFLKVIDALREIRQDFKVWIPLWDTKDRSRESFVYMDKGEKQWYYNELKKCYVGFSPKQQYGGWSVATTDGMMNGVPYIMYNDTYYKELCPHADFFEDNKTAVLLLDTYLSDKLYRNEQATMSRDWISKKLIYKDKMVEMSEYIDELIEQTKTMGESDTFKKIVEWIKEEGVLRKDQIMTKLGWGRGIKWSPYRKALMNHPNIYDVEGEYPIYCWKE
jgi:hypothetical protein